MPGAAGTVKLQNVQEIFGVSKKLCLSFAEHVGIKHVGDDASHRPTCRALSNISPHHSPQGSGRTLCAPTGGIPSQSPPHHSKPVFSLTIIFQGHLACPFFTQKTAPYPIKSGVQHRFFLSYSINSIIMLCAFVPAHQYAKHYRQHKIDHCHHHKAAKQTAHISNQQVFQGRRVNAQAR